MKKKLFALSGVFLIVLVITGLWATRATDIMGVEPSSGQEATALALGLSVEEMTAGASLIVMGKCIGTRSQWSDRNLVTLATMLVEESLKGAAANEVTVVLPGGIDFNRPVPIATTYPGAPQISLDERAFLFLTDEDKIPGSYAVMGFAQGKYSVVEDDAGEPVVTRDLTRVRMQKGVGVTRGNFQAVPLSEFKKRVMDYLNK